jgi:4-hydroxybenzoate polyprenyltransferase
VLKRVRLMLEMIRFSHTIFALPFALLSATLAWQEKPFHWLDLVGILLCMVFARSAAMAFNRLADRKYDAANPRTAARHLPTGQIAPGAVWVFAIACCVGFVSSTLIFWHSDNAWPFYLSIPVLVFIGTYSFAKRFTALSHFWLGASLMMAPVAAWIAIRGLENLLTPVVLGLAVLVWVAGFDMIYACQDAEFDRRIGLFSLPARIGIRASLRLAALCHVAMIALLVLLYAVAPTHLGTLYLVGVGGIAGLLIYEHWLVRPDDLRRVNEAFLYVNGVISIGLLVIVWVQLAVK